jgi:hypothetical protein
VCKQNGEQRPAYADAKLSVGPWGYVCKEHFGQYGCSLGLGRGQELILRAEEARADFKAGESPSEANGYACQICGQPGGH